MFELTNQTVKLTSFSPNAEIHGKDRKPVSYLKFETKCPNDVLISFHPELRAMLYKRNDSPDLVDQIDQDALTALRTPKLGQMKWHWEGTGYTITIDHGLGGKSDIVLGEVKLDNFRFVPQEGGTVILLFRAVCHPTKEYAGELYLLIQREIEISVTPPEATSADDLFKNKEVALA